MENHVDTSVQELTTEAMQDIDTMGQELTAAEERPIDNVTTDGQKAPAETQGPNRRRKQKSFTMDDGVHALLATQADAAGVSMSGYLETLILSAEDLSLDPRVIEILGAQATSIGMTKKDLLEMLILRAEHVVSWDQQTADALGVLGVLANRAGLSRQEFLECLLVRAEDVMTWQPPKLRARSWWRFWEQPEWEEPEPVFPAVMERLSRPRLAGKGSEKVW